MDLGATDSESRFSAYVEALVGVIGHADRAGPLRDYCMGLLMPGERKSVEPMAAVTAPARVAAQHQSLLHFVGKAPWSDERVLAGCGSRCCRRSSARTDRGLDRRRHRLSQEGQAFGRRGAAVLRPARQAGQLSGGGEPVGRQPCGQPADRLAALSAGGLGGGSGAARQGGRAGGGRLRDQARDRAGADPRRVAAGMPRGVVLMDAGYGVKQRAAQRDHRARARLHRGHPAEHPRPAGGRSARPQPARRGARQGARGGPAGGGLAHRHLARGHGGLARLALRPAAGADRACGAWVEPGAGGMAADRVARGRGRADQILALHLPEDMPLEALVDRAKLRWRIERDYQELKQELGLGHYEGRGWRGFHHHATLCIAAYGFLVSERETIPPSGPRTAAKREEPALPAGYRPRGAADPTRAARPELDRDPPPPPHRRARQHPRAMSLLPRATKPSGRETTFMTQ